VLRVTIDPVGADKNLQMPSKCPITKRIKMMPVIATIIFFPLTSDKKLPKYSRYESVPAERRVFQIMDAAWSVKSSARGPAFPCFANPQIRFRRAGKFGARENCSPGRRGDPQTGPQSKQSHLHLAAIKHIIVGLMANSEDSQTIAREMLPFREASSAAVAEPGPQLAT